MADQRRFLIIGQGLAGTALAWRFWERGVAFVVVDREEPVTCSKIAAGLVTPVTGMRLNLNWRFAELREEAVSFYQRVEACLGRQVWFPLDQVRLFRDAAARDLFRRRLEDPAVARQVTLVDWGEAGEARLLDPGQFRMPHGCFEQTGGGYLDTAVYLEQSRRFFSSVGRWRPGRVEAEDVRHEAGGGLRWAGEDWSGVFFCQGWEAARHPWFDWVPFDSARGSIVTAQAVGWTGTPEPRVVNSSGCWLLPRGHGAYRLGPTYEPGFDPAEAHEPSPGKLKGLREKVEALAVGPLAWASVATAVRPIVKSAKLLMGRHPRLDSVGFLNGLGSKGALRAPWAAARLVAHWLDGEPLEPEVDLRGNL